MEKSNTSDQELLEQIVAKLFNAREEIEQLATALSSDHGAAADEFEKIKSDFMRKLSALAELIPPGDKGDALRLAVTDLKENLCRGVVHDGDTFIEQKQNILFALSNVGKNSLSIGHGTGILELEHEVEKLKLKLEILGLRFTIGRLVIGKAFHESLRQASGKIKGMTDGLSSAVSKGTGRVEDVRKESLRIYKHLKKSIGTLVH